MIQINIFKALPQKFRNTRDYHLTTPPPNLNNPRPHRNILVILGIMCTLTVIQNHNDIK